MGKKKPQGESRNRLLWVSLVLISWMILIIWRLSWLQVVKHEYYAKKAAGLQQDSEMVMGPRGSILDRNNREMAYSVIYDSLYADQNLIKKEEARTKRAIRQTAAQNIASLLGVSEEQLMQDLTGDSGFVWIRRRIDPGMAPLIKKIINEKNLSGLGIKQESQRFYPNDNIGSHVIGYVGSEDKGQAGLELTQDEFLKGRPGEVHFSRGARKTRYNSWEIPALPGNQIRTSIDIGLQYKVEVLLDEVMKRYHAKGAHAIVMDPSSGEILVMANAPTFNPNVRLKTGGEDDRNNKSISTPFDPGSIFKIVTYAAAIEEGLARPDEMINCGNGQISFGPRIIHDTHAYGTISVADAFAKSSNVGAIKLAMRVGKEKFHDYITRFGFGSRMITELPGESKGIVRPLSSWNYDSIGSVAMGQEISVTLLQAVSSVAIIANKGVWVQPHVITQKTSSDGRVLFEARPVTRQVISPETARIMTSMLERVVTTGTGRYAIQLQGYTAAGKTGTPQKVDPITKAYSKSKYMPSFAGFVPATNPRFAIIVMVDEPIGAYYGASVAAPVFNMIAEAALGDFVIPPDEKSFREDLVRLANKYESEIAKEDGAQEKLTAETATKPAPIPSPTPQKKTERIETGSDVKVSANLPPSAIPRKQAPPQKTKGSVIAVTDSPDSITGTIEMPDLRGRGMRAATQFCSELGLKPRLIGSGIVVRQYPAPGTRLRPGEECRLEFQ